jgi:transcriptional regulator with XRE-family HTH domain
VPVSLPTTSAQLGAAIRLLRKSRGMTIEGLAAEAEIHWTYLSGIENGKRNPSWEIIGKLATALEVSVADIVRVAGEQAESVG